ncbi:condensation domain-containing protein, partial [Methylosinus sp. Sm6]|uniref:condensation domain-containing protein n=1 Tax=Methylosinus sp. Sm6 TaxID=2866948 RepID=UPI001C99A1C0
PFRDFVARARSGADRAQQEAFFARMLSDVSEPTIPFGLSNVRGDGSCVGEAEIDLDADLAARARACARALGVGAASLFHQAFALVLSRICGRADVVFGTVLSGRTEGGERTSRTLGIFINTLPARIRIGSEAAASGVRRTHALLLDLMRHESAPLSLAQRCSGVVAPTPLFSALLNYR